MTKALVVIDVQKYFIDENTKKIPQKIADYIKKNKFDQIVFFRFINNKDTPFYKFCQWKDMMGPPETDFCPEIEKISHKEFSRSIRSCMSEDFRKFLEEKGVDELFLCGFNTDECVLTTAFDAFDRGFKVSIIEKLCSSHNSKESHKAAMKVLGGQFEII